MHSSAKNPDLVPRKSDAAPDAPPVNAEDSLVEDTSIPVGDEASKAEEAIETAAEAKVTDEA